MNMVEKTCRCGKKYKAREADLKRGWGKSCSKSCAAMKRTAREARGNFRIAAASSRYATRKTSRQIDDYDPSWDAHKFGH